MSKLELASNHSEIGVSQTEASLQKYRRNITLIHVLSFLMGVHFFGAVMIAFFEGWAGMRFSQIMLLESIFTGAIFLFEIPTGTIADKYGRKLSLNLGISINVVAIFVYILYPNFWVLAAGEIIWALGAALNSGAYEALVYDSLLELGREKESKNIYSRVRSLSLAGMVMGTIAGGFMASAWGAWSTMALSAIPLALAAFVGLFLVEPTQHEQSKKDTPWQIFRKGLETIKGNKGLKRIIIDSIILSVIAYYSIWLWQSRLMDLGVDMAYFGLIHAGMIIIQIILLNMIQPLEKLLRSKKALVILTGVGMGGGFILFGITNNVGFVITGILLAAGLRMSRRTFMTNYMQKHIDSGQRATTLSTVSMARMFLIMCINPIVGYLTEYSITGVLLGLGTLAILWSLCTPVKESYLED